MAKEFADKFAGYEEWRPRQDDEAFREWREKPTTRMVISMIPPLPVPDALLTLLRDAFHCGASQGRASIALEMLVRLMPSQDKGGAS